MNGSQNNLRRWQAIAWLASGVFVCLGKTAWSQLDGQRMLAPGCLFLHQDKLYCVSPKFCTSVTPLTLDFHGTQLVLTNANNQSSFAIDNTGQLTATNVDTTKQKLKRRMLVDTRNPKLDKKDLEASSWRYVYGLEVDPLDGPDAPPPPELRKAVVIAAEEVELTLAPDKKFKAHPVLLRSVKKGDTLLRFEVGYTSGK